MLPNRFCVDCVAGVIDGGCETAVVFNALVDPEVDPNEKIPLGANGPLLDANGLAVLDAAKVDGLDDDDIESVTSFDEFPIGAILTLVSIADDPRENLKLLDPLSVLDFVSGLEKAELDDWIPKIFEVLAATVDELFIELPN